MNLAKLDPRSLALCRILLGIITLLDGIYRFIYAGDFLSDGGIWSSEFVRTFGWQRGYWSLYLLSSSDFWMYLLLVLQMLFSVLFIIGFGGKITQFLLWVLLVSVQNRNLYILQSGDDLLRIFLFFGLWTDMFDYFTVGIKNRIRYSYLRIHPANFLLLFQIFCVYSFTVILKFFGNDWLPDGKAVYFALSIDQIRYPAGDFLYSYPKLMKFLTYLVYIIELLIPILIFMPYKTEKARGWAFLLILFIHVGFALTMKIGFFPFVSMATSAILIPSGWWGRLSESFQILTARYDSDKFPFYNLFTDDFPLTFIFLFTVLSINLSGIKSFPFEPARPLEYFINILRLNQYWGMFSPNIPRTDGWHEAWGRKENGGIVVLESPVFNSPGQKPPQLHPYFPTDRWRKLIENLSRDEYTFLRPMFCKYLIKKYSNEIRANNVVGLELVFFREINLDDFGVKGPEKEIWCYCTLR